MNTVLKPGLVVEVFSARVLPRSASQTIGQRPSASTNESIRRLVKRTHTRAYSAAQCSQRVKVSADWTVHCSANQRSYVPPIRKCLWTHPAIYSYSHICGG